MLIYKNVKGNKCENDGSMKKCNDALDPNKYEKKNFLLFKRCVNLTYKEYTDKDYINNNIYCEEFTTQLSTIKSEIKNHLENIPIVNAFLSKVPLPIYVMIAKVIEYDPDDENANLAKYLKKDFDDSLKKKMDSIENKLKKTSVVKYTFQGNYKIVLYIPNLMKILRGENINKYTYFPSITSASHQNRWMNLLANKKSMFLKAVKNNFDFKNELIEKIGDEYLSKNSEEKEKIDLIIREKNKDGWEKDLLYFELEKSCLNMGCVSEEGEDLDEIIPMYNPDGAIMEYFAKKNSPYHVAKCLQTQNFGEYMYDEDSKREKFAKNARKLIEEKYETNDKIDSDLRNNKLPEGEYFSGKFESVVKMSIAESRSKTYDKPGKKDHQYSKHFNLNILKDLAKRYRKYPGVPEMTFRLYKLDELDSEFKSLFHYMPWGNNLLTQEYVLNENDIMRIDDIVIDRNDLSLKTRTLPFKSFDNTSELKFNDNGILSVYKNGSFLRLVRGTEGINMKKYKNRTLKLELNNLQFFGDDIHAQNDIRGVLPIEIIDKNAKLPNSLIVDSETGNLLLYDLGYNVINRII
tara:strand:+ start:3664 stop:5391 length:1728 start_codon:yes stop_codon:yes gene_type:complete